MLATEKKQSIIYVYVDTSIHLNQGFPNPVIEGRFPAWLVSGSHCMVSDISYEKWVIMAKMVHRSSKTVVVDLTQ